MINSVDMTVSLSDKKTESVKRTNTEILHKERVTIRDVCRVIGKIIATMPANRFARRFTTRAIILKDQALRESGDDYDSVIHLSEEVIEDLKEQERLIEGTFCPIFESRPQLTLKTDGSHQGWGYLLLSERTISDSLGVDGALNMQICILIHWKQQRSG